MFVVDSSRGVLFGTRLILVRAVLTSVRKCLLREFTECGE